MYFKSLITLIVLLAFSAVFAELKAPAIDSSEKPGQRKLDVINEQLAKPIKEQSSSSDEVSVMEMVIKTMLGLGFIVLLIFVLVYLMRKLQGGTLNRLAGQEVDHVHAHILPRKKDDGMSCKMVNGLRDKKKE